MMGGKEDPCIPWLNIKRLQETTGALCPRVELLPENRDAAELSLTAARIGFDHPLWRLQFDLAGEGSPPGARREMLYLVLTVVSSESVSAKIVQERERSARRRTRKK